jgi:hypothetical protein
VTQVNTSIMTTIRPVCHQVFFDQFYQKSYYYLTAVGLTAGGSSFCHVQTQILRENVVLISKSKDRSRVDALVTANLF